MLWTLWTGGRTPHGWPNRLRTAAIHGSRSADHDLDAVMALVDAAERLAGRYPGFLGVRTFVDSLADQQIPAEAVADRGTRADAVRILTAHRAKGLEWDEVWIVGAEEGVWPDLRARGSTLRAEELTSTGVGSGPRPADLLEEERRLFYVACTRARRQLHITAIDEKDAGGERPSRFLDDVRAALGLAEVPPVSGRPRHQVSLDGLVAELRLVAMDPASSDALREAAVERLAVLAAQRDPDGEPLVPLADPARWWGLLDPTVSDRPVRDPEAPVSLSGSGLDSILGCPLKWFLEHEVRAETPRGTATSFGSVVHAVADFVAKGDIPETLEDMDAEVDRVWSELRFEAGWQSESERREARAALARFLGYHLRADRELVGTETRVGAEVVVPTPDGGTETVRLSGFIDRVERDGQGRLVPIDLKNMRYPVAQKDIPEHGQLGVYQLLLREGGMATADPERADEPAAAVEVGGAALVQLRVDAGKGVGRPQGAVPGGARRRRADVGRGQARRRRPHRAHGGVRGVPRAGLLLLRLQDGLPGQGPGRAGAAMTARELTRASLDAALGLTLTDEQWAAVRSEFAPAVIVAGAGSGKTTSMAARVAWLVGSGYVRPDQVLGLTFTTKAAAQLLSSMRSSVSALVDGRRCVERGATPTAIRSASRRC